MSHHHVIVFTFGSDTVQSELGNVMLDILNSKLSRMRNTIRFGVELANQWRSKTTTGKLGVGRRLQAVQIYSYVSTQAQLVYIKPYRFIAMSRLKQS